MLVLTKAGLTVVSRLNRDGSIEYLLNLDSIGSMPLSRAEHPAPENTSVRLVIMQAGGRKFTGKAVSRRCRGSSRNATHPHCVVNMSQIFEPSNLFSFPRRSSDVIRIIYGFVTQACA